MKKNTLIILMFLVVSFSKAQTTTSFTLEQEITGNVKVNVNAFGFSSWEIKYWEVNLPESSATVSNFGSYSTVRFKINPFKSWNFRVKVIFGGVGDWSQIETLDNSCTNLPNYVGFSDNFSTNPILNCWRGYFLNSNPNSYDYITYSTNNWIQLASQNGSKFVVSPRFEDLSTDKKVKFKLKSNLSGSFYSIKVGTITDPYDETTFHELGSFSTTASNQFELKTLFLNNYNGVDKYIAFKLSNVGSYNYSIDDFSYEQSVNCIDASNINFTNITSNSAVINFDSSSQTNWEMKLKNTITNVELSIPLTSGSFNISNLNAGTTYEVKLRANCDVGLYSNWSQIMSFTTLCENITPGYFNDFNGTNYLDPCWKNISSVPSNITIENSTSMPLSGNYLSFTGSSNASNNTFLVSPYIENFSDKRIKFKLYDNRRGDFLKFPLTIGVLTSQNDINSFIPIKTYTPEEINPISLLELESFWQSFYLNFNDFIFPSNAHFLGLKIENYSNVNYYDSKLLMDDFYFENEPICSEPSNIQITEINHNNVKLTWNGGNADSWQIEYGVAGFSQGSGIIVDCNATTYLLEDLTPSTSYDFFIISKCGVNLSQPSIRRNFKTYCEGVTVGYSYGFENESFIPLNTCWKRINPTTRNYNYNSNYFINIYNSNQFAGQSSHSGSKLAVMRGGNDSGVPDSQNKIILVTPKLLDLDSNKIIKFWAYCKNDAYSSLQSIVIGTLSNPNDLDSFTPFQTISSPFTLNQWIQYTVDFSSYYGTDKFVGIKQISSNSRYNLAIDDFEYLQNPCNKPTGLRAYQSGQNSITLTWNSNIVGSTDYQIEYGTLGFTPGNGTILNVTGNSTTINNLTLFSKYQFRVRNICSNGSVNWSDLLPFKITCLVNAPFYENFDQYQSIAGFGYLDPNLCWSSLNAMNASIFQYSLNNVNSSPNVAFVESNSAGEGVFVSPYLADFDNTKTIKFWTRLQVLSSSQNLSIIVGIVENPMDLSTFVPYQTFPLSYLSQAGQEFLVNFSSYTGNSKHIAFKTSGFVETSYITNRIFIDDVYYYDTPDCSEPIDVNFNQTNHNSTLLKWTNIGPVQTTKIEYGLSGFTQGNGTILYSNSNQILVTGLNETSDYHFYLNAICNNSDSPIVGPFNLRTTCIPTAIPWFESFNNLSQYGQGMLPSCFKLPGVNNISSRNNPITSIYNNFSPDHLLTGFDDTFYLHAEDNTWIFTPMFHLEQGTSYKFSLKARKRYEYDSSNIKISTFRGQETYAHISDLVSPSYLSEYEYNEGNYFYTPIETGDYSFLLYYNSSGSLEIISDNFSLDEGYPSVINSNRLINFNQGIDNELILEKTQKTTINLQNINSNNVLKLSGSTDSSSFISSQNVWAENQNSITKVNFKIASEDFQSLFLSFKLKQTYSQQNTNSALRLIVNGINVGNIIYPVTTDQDEFQTYEYDLTSFLGSDLKISLQHIGKSTADNAFLDDISINQNSLSIMKNNYLNDIKVYPNPTEGIITVKSNTMLNSLIIYNLSGQKLEEFQDNFIEKTINLFSYSEGFYLIKVSSENGSKILKICKKN